MIRIPHRRMLAAAFALFCAACGGPSPADEARALLRADSAFSTPVTIRIPRTIHVSARVANDGMNDLGDIASYGPEQYHRLNAPMNVLRAAGMVRVLDRSRRVRVFTASLGYACTPSNLRRDPAYRGYRFCGRDEERRGYDYAHTVEVVLTTAPGAEWREDTEPWTGSFADAGFVISPGWVVELARREIVDVGEVRKPEIGALEVDYTWRWALTPTGSYFDPDGATQGALPASMRTFAIAGMAEAPRADTVYKATALLLYLEGAWKMSNVRFR